MSKNIRPWWLRSGDALSQLINAAVLRGEANESISGRASRIVRWDNPDHKAWQSAYKVINTIFFREENHCDAAYDADVRRAGKLLHVHNQRVQRASRRAANFG